MKNELQQLFSGLPTERREKDGAIIEKPILCECNDGGLIGMVDDPQCFGNCEFDVTSVRRYNEATEVTPVPDWMEFWEYLSNMKNPHTSAGLCMQLDKYLEFVKCPLSLSDFIPCNENGEPMEEPVETIGGVEQYSKQYQHAVDRVVWLGWAVAMHDKDHGHTSIKHAYGYLMHFDSDGAKMSRGEVLPDYNTAINNKLPLYLEVKK